MAIFIRKRRTGYRTTAPLIVAAALLIAISSSIGGTRGSLGRLRPTAVQAAVVSGNTPWIVLLCKAADQPAEPQTRQYLSDFLTDSGAGKGGMSDYWRQVSHGAISLAGSFASAWQPTAKTQAELQTEGRSQKLQDCIDAHPELSDTFPRYYGIIAAFNYAVLPGAGDSGAIVTGQSLLSIGDVVQPYAQVVLEPWSWTVTLAAHEMGHGYGLQHSDSQRSQICSLNARPGEYCDQWDIMSASNVKTFQGPWTVLDGRGLPTGPAGPGLNAVNLDALGWMPTARRYTHGGSTASIRLAALNSTLDPGYLMATVSIDASPQLYYTVEYRRPTGWDAGIPADTVLIHFSRGDGFSYIIDHDGDDQWLPGQTFTDAPAGISITVNALGLLDGAHYAADVTIVDTGVNSAPSFNVPPTLATNLSQVRPGGFLGVTGQNFIQPVNSTGNQASVYFDSKDAGPLLTRSTIDQTGTFTATIMLPTNAAAGRHVLIAVFEDQIAQTGIEVIAPAQALQPRLSIVGNRSTVASVEGTMRYQVNGEGFAAGVTVQLYLDKPVGTPLATTTASPDGAFQVQVQIPDTFGQHHLVAQQTVAGQPVQASIAIFVQPLPQ